MKAVVRFGLTMALVAGLAASASAQTAAAQRTLTPTARITYTGTVTEIDYNTRIVTTRGTYDGQLATFEVPASSGSAPSPRVAAAKATPRRSPGRQR